MSLSSIQNYESDDSNYDSDHDEIQLPSSSDPAPPDDVKQDKCETPSSDLKPTNFFATASDSNSGSDSECSSDDDDAGLNRVRPGSSQIRLPSALSVLNDADNDPLKSSSIFCNPFKEAEEAEFNLLQQHVKMSERKMPQKPVKKSRLPCKMFKKGRCRLGDQCRFSHVVGAALMARLAEPTSTDDGNGQEYAPSAPSTFESNAVKYNSREEALDDGSDNDEAPKRKKRNRVGVTNSLVPPKKALQLFDEQLKKDSPWSYNKS